MPDDEVEESILALLRAEMRLTVPDGESDLIAMGLIDSLTLVELIFQLEQRFGLTVALDDLDPDNFANVRRMADFVRVHRSPG